EDPPGNPANTLQGRVSALRRSLGSEGSGLVVTRPPGYLLEVAPEQVDAGRFERLGGQGLAGSGTAGLLEEALGLWRGPALAEFADQPWAQAEAARLEELRLGAPPAPGRARRGRRGAAPRGWAGGGGPRAGTPGWSGSWRGWWPPTRPGSGCGASCCWPSTGRAVRPTPSAPTPGPGRGWPRRWGSPPRPSCNACTTRCWSRTRPWGRRPRPGTSLGTTCPSGSPAWSGGKVSCGTWPSWSPTTGWSPSPGRAGPARPAWPWPW